MKKLLRLTVGLVATGVLAGGAAAFTTAGAAAPAGSGWQGVTREQVRIDFGQGWVTGAELTYPNRARGRLPVVVLLHGSGHNDLNQSLPDGKGSTFVPLAQAAGREGFATLRFNKRGVTGVGPVLSTDPAQLNPTNPYERIQRDAADIARFPTVTQALPRFPGPTLLLNGENDLQTPARAALAADAAVAAAGNRDHRVVIYPGMAHTMNITPKFTPEFGEPDRQVVDDIRGWLRSHR